MNELINKWQSHSSLTKSLVLLDNKPDLWNNAKVIFGLNLVLFAFIWGKCDFAVKNKNITCFFRIHYPQKNKNIKKRFRENYRSVFAHFDQLYLNIRWTRLLLTFFQKLLLSELLEILTQKFQSKTYNRWLGRQA